jgi:hypothetical protein
MRRWKDHQRVPSAYIFTGYTAVPIIRATFWHLGKRAGQLSGIRFSIHPHICDILTVRTCDPVE